MADPVGFCKKAQTGPEQGVATDGIMNVVLANRQSPNEKKQPKWCSFYRRRHDVRSLSLMDQIAVGGVARKRRAASPGAVNLLYKQQVS